MKAVRICEPDFENPEELTSIARICCEVPRYWDPKWEMAPNGVVRFLNRIVESRSDEDQFIRCAKSPSGELLGIHWLKVEKVDPKTARYSGFRMTPAEETVAFILSLWIRDDHWGLGIAKELKLRGEEWARTRGASRISTSVHCQNKRMFDINLKCGFEAGTIAMSKDL